MLDAFVRRAGGREFQIFEAVALKLQVPNEAWIDGTDTRLMFDNLGE